VAHLLNGKMKSFISIVLTLTLLTNCSQKSETSKSETTAIDSFDNNENNDFKIYLSTFDKIKLPITIDGCESAFAGKTIVEKGKDVELLATDNPYVAKTGYYLYGQIPANGNYIAIIRLGLADCLIPELTTYDLSGNKIDRKSIAIGYCGSDCGYHCDELMKIVEDYTIFTSDTVESFTCDSLGQIIPETKENYVIYKQGRLLPSGKIELSEAIRKELLVK
jgi:hypothetical protein